MVCPVRDNTLTMLLVQCRNREDGLFLVLVPNEMDACQVQEGFTEMGITPQKVMEIGNWMTTETGIAASFLPYSVEKVTDRKRG